ncbi:MAG: addiction module toxin, HicA family [Nitrospirae bacterium]|nr:MAG: addiction module toxin, HicA family [Nitrospirota bacterium]
MSQEEKMLQKMKNNPRDWSIENIITVTGRHGIECRNDGGSHNVFSHPEIAEAVTVPAHRPIKPVYIKKIVELIEKTKEL